MNDLKFSLFYSEKGIKETTPKDEINTPGLFKIYNSTKLIELSKGVREATGESQNILKSKLPFITPYGTFSQRSNANIEHYNQNLIALDFDYLEPNQIEEIKEICRHSENVLLCALSPRNKGLKILAIINHEFTIENHATGIKQNLSKILQILNLDKFNPDTAQFTLSQAFFLCHDKDMIFNLNATAKNKPLQVLKPTRKEIKSNKNTFNKDRVTKFIEGILNKNIETMIQATPGNRHATILLNIKAFGLIRNYASELENDYFKRLEKAIEFVYFEDPPEQRDQALKTLVDIQQNATAQSLDIIEEIKRENESIETALNCFINDIQFKSEKDEIKVFSNDLINWSYDGYLIAQKRNNELIISFSGFPTAKKIDRLKNLPGVDIIETSNGILLNGSLWKGSKTIVETKTLSHANS